MHKCAADDALNALMRMRHDGNAYRHRTMHRFEKWKNAANFSTWKRRRRRRADRLSGGFDCGDIGFSFSRTTSSFSISIESPAHTFHICECSSFFLPFFLRPAFIPALIDSCRLYAREMRGGVKNGGRERERGGEGWVEVEGTWCWILIVVEHVRSFGEQNTSSKWIIAARYLLCWNFYVNHFRSLNASANLNRKR